MSSVVRQEIGMLTATFQPSGRTVTHTHRLSVTVYVLEGAFTLELDGREPLTIKAEEDLVEPHGCACRGSTAATLIQRAW
jgi:quercetin dioxygenase-like cupin family protein